MDGYWQRHIRIVVSRGTRAQKTRTVGRGCMGIFYALQKSDFFGFEKRKTSCRPPGEKAAGRLISA